MTISQPAPFDGPPARGKRRAPQQESAAAAADLGTHSVTSGVDLASTPAYMPTSARPDDLRDRHSPDSGAAIRIRRHRRRMGKAVLPRERSTIELVATKRVVHGSFDFGEVSVNAPAVRMCR
jgi:hypothetical protein